MNDQITEPATEVAPRTLVQKISGQVDAFLSFFTVGLSGFIKEVGLVVIFATESIKLLFAKPYRGAEIIKHMEFIGRGRSSNTYILRSYSK